MGWNKIGYAGITALATEIGKGALPSLLELKFSGNMIGNASLTALASACGIGALRNLESMNLSDNNIGDAGPRFVI